MKGILSYLIAIALLACPVSRAFSAALNEQDEAARGLLDGRALIRAGRYLEAADKLRAALTRAEQSGQSLMAALALANIAEIYRLSGENDKAANYYREALKRYRASGRQNGIEISRKKIDELPEPDTSRSIEPDRERLIDQAVERVRTRLKEKAKGRD